MVNKYARHLEERDIYIKTGQVWTINDVPNTWRAKTKAKVENDGYYFAEDGTAYPNESEETPFEE